MRKYWSIAKNSIKEFIEYRLNLGFEVIGGVLYCLVLVWLWRTISMHQPGGNIGEFSAAGIVTYLIGCGVITSYFYLTGQGDNINDDINRGFLSSVLVKPLHPLIYWFVRDVTRKIVTFSIGMIGFIAIGLWYHQLIVPPSSFIGLLMFLVCVLIAGIMHFLLYGIIALMAFWLEQTWGERFVLRVLSEFASGMLVPLSFFPGAAHSPCCSTCRSDFLRTCRCSCTSVIFLDPRSCLK